MISCRLKGGLCNQLFQIFATIAYCIQYNYTFVFPYDEFLMGVTKRKTYWEDFLSPLKLFTAQNPVENTINNSRMLPNLTNDIIKSFPVKYYYQHHYQEIEKVGIDENICFDGYFQSYRYFQKYENTIFSLMRLDNQLKSVKQEYFSFFDDHGTIYYTISMHFRLGDYKNLQEHHNILPFEYYQKSLETIITNIKAKNLRILYFCEEEDNDYVSKVVNRLLIDFNNKLYHEIENIQFIKVYDTIPDWKQLLLMGCCDSNIIANSSFSWWGAYFNRNGVKKVCYPSLWFGPNLSHNYLGDMFPDEWIKIDI